MKPAHLLFFASIACAALAQESAMPLASLPLEAKGAILQTTRAVYPVRLLHEGVTSGEAVLLLETDRNGTLTDVLPIAFTHRLFAEAAMTAARQWRYEPPRIGMERIGLAVEVTFVFRTDGVLAIDKRGYQEPRETPPPRFKYVYEAHGSHNLDTPPRPLDLPQPTYPEEWVEDGRTGRVTITFYIDEAGHTRVPIVEQDSNPDEWLASVALAAVRKWRFEPCTSEGERVLVRAQQTFVFGQTTASTAAGRSVRR